MKKTFILIIFSLAVWSFLIEPNMLTVTTISLKVDELKGVKVVFFSDLHVKPNQKRNLVRVVKKINELHPDLVLSTGDFVSGHKAGQSLSIEKIAKILSQVKTKYGFYAVLGNHDWWQGGEKIKSALEKNGIVVLSNDNAVVNIAGKKLFIVGVEDMSTRKFDLVKALEKASSSSSILLTHSPDVFPFVADATSSEIFNNVDLTLAGHTHGGQVNIPFVGPLVVSSSYGKRYAAGLIKEGRKIMFVTKGIGTSILPVRFNCIPEIVVINFD